MAQSTAHIASEAKKTSPANLAKTNNTHPTINIVTIAFIMIISSHILGTQSTLFNHFYQIIFPRNSAVPFFAEFCEFDFRKFLRYINIKINQKKWLKSVDWKPDVGDYIIMMRRTEMQHTFDENTLSDLHKDARGFRPRSEYFWAEWNEASDDGKQAIWDGLCDEMVRRCEEEAAYEQACVEEFKALVEKTMGYGAPDRESALRWITDSEIFNHSQDVESYVYSRGILFTDYGRELVKELMEIVIFEDPEY